MSEKGTVYFFTGLAGAGKTTIGGLFYQKLKAQKPNVFLADGDQTRSIFGRSGYSTEARLDAARRGFRLWRELTEQGIDVVVCSIAMYREIQQWNRENIENYREIYIRVTRETLYRRDQKQLYSSGRKEVVGVDLPYDEPRDADVVVQNDGQETPEEIVSRLRSMFGL
ncbi:adenylyl-sulfate kinase [Oscillospiraceae bacterium 50-58]